VPPRFIKIIQNSKLKIQNCSTLEPNKTAFLLSMPFKYKYPLKVVTIRQDDRILIVTAYPLKKGGIG